MQVYSDITHMILQTMLRKIKDYQVSNYVFTFISERIQLEITRKDRETFMNVPYEYSFFYHKINIFDSLWGWGGGQSVPFVHLWKCW